MPSLTSACFRTTTGLALTCMQTWRLRHSLAACVDTGALAPSQRLSFQLDRHTSSHVPFRDAPLSFIHSCTHESRTQVFVRVVQRPPTKWLSTEEAQRNSAVERSSTPWPPPRTHAWRRPWLSTLDTTEAHPGDVDVAAAARTRAAAPGRGRSARPATPPPTHSNARRRQAVLGTH